MTKARTVAAKRRGRIPTLPTDDATLATVAAAQVEALESPAKSATLQPNPEGETS